MPVSDDLGGDTWFLVDLLFCGVLFCFIAAQVGYCFTLQQNE
jgi:hypothetical protein